MGLWPVREEAPLDVEAIAVEVRRLSGRAPARGARERPRSAASEMA